MARMKRIGITVQLTDAQVARMDRICERTSRSRSSLFRYMLKQLLEAEEEEEQKAAEAEREKIADTANLGVGNV